MLSIHPEVQDLGNEDKTIYETYQINKENMREFCIFIAEEKSENTKHKTKLDKQTLCKFCRKKYEYGEVKCVLLSTVILW